MLRKVVALLGLSDFQDSGIILDEFNVVSENKSIRIAADERYSQNSEESTIRVHLELIRRTFCRVILFYGSWVNPPLAGPKVLHAAYEENMTASYSHFVWITFSYNLMDYIVDHQSDDLRALAAGRGLMTLKRNEINSATLAFERRWNTLKPEQFPMLVRDGSPTLSADLFNGSLPDKVTYAYDAALALAVAISELLGRGFDESLINGKLLLDTLIGVTFEGVSGPVKFNAQGDRVMRQSLVMIPLSTDAAESIEPEIVRSQPCD